MWPFLVKMLTGNLHCSNTRCKFLLKIYLACCDFKITCKPIILTCVVPFGQSAIPVEKYNFIPTCTLISLLLFRRAFLMHNPHILLVFCTFLHTAMCINEIKINYAVYFGNVSTWSYQLCKLYLTRNLVR